MDVEFEIRDLKRRVGDLEGAVNVLAGRPATLHPELVSMQEQSAERFSMIDAKITQVVSRLDTLNTQTWSLRDDLPDLIAGALAKARAVKEDRC